MKRKEVSVDELWKRPSVRVSEAQQMTGYSKNLIYDRMDDGTYQWSYAGTVRMIVTQSLREAESKLAAERLAKKELSAV